MTVIVEEGLALMQPRSVCVSTPVPECTYNGTEIVDTSSIVAVSIIRAGDALLDVFMDICPDCVAGKILIQRNEETATAQLYYSRLPSLVDKHVVLCDPMLATGGSAIVAIRVLIEKGVQPHQITFLNVVACPEGLANIMEAFPDLTIVTGCVDQGLNSTKYIVPGLGDYGDRFFGTVGV